MKKRAFSLVIIVLLCIVSLTACSAEQYFVYGTFLEIDVKGVGSGKLKAAIHEYIAGLEPILSPTVEGSDVYRINDAPEGVPVVCAAVTMEVLAIAMNVCELSGGAYDPSVYPLVRLWNFSSDTFGIAGVEKRPPSDSEIAEALKLVGFSRAFEVSFETSTVTKKQGFGGAMLDFGGVAKGYAADKAGELVGAKQRALINLGGNIAAVHDDYGVGVANPRTASAAYYGSFTLTDGNCVSTSGDYERYYKFEGKRYHHIIDPFTGRPAESGLVSATVITPDGGLGDALSTAVMILGRERGTKLIEELGLKAILIDSELGVYTVGDLDFVKK